MLSSNEPLEMPAVAPGDALLLGLEQEFDLSDGDQDLDFRGLYPRAIGRARSFPFRNCDSAAIVEAGYMLGCDGKEAEFATAPIHLNGDGPLALAHEAIRCRSHMLQLLHGAGVPVVRGYSTHLSVSVPPGREREIAEAFSFMLAPALVLLLEARSSPGLLLRPRRGRLEVGSEYVDDESQLTAAIAFLAGAVQAYLFHPERWRELPRLARRKWQEADIRPGIYLPRDAYGESIHNLGRSALLELEGGGTIASGEVLRLCGDLALCALEGLVKPRGLQALREAISRPGSLQIERGGDSARIGPLRPGRAAAEAYTLRRLTRPLDNGLTLRFIDWEGAAFDWKRAGTDVVLGVPWSHLPAIFSAAPSRIMAQMPAGGPQGRLDSLDQLRTPQAFQSMDPVALGTQAVSDKGGSVKGGPGKPPMQLGYTEQRMVQRLPPSPVIPRRLPLMSIGLAIGLLFLMVIGVGALMLRGGGGQFARVSSGASATSVSNGAVALVKATDTPTPVGACLPNPTLVYPPSGALRTGNTLVQWSSTVGLGAGQTFAILAARTPDELNGPNAQADVVGTAETTSFSLDFTKWKYAGALGSFYWTVRIQAADGAFVDCGGSKPSIFGVRTAPTPTKPPKEGSGSSSGSGGGGGGKP